MKALYFLPIVFLMQSCNAQNNSNMNINSNVCGGYTSNNRTTKPLENVSGEVEHLYFHFYNGNHSDNLPTSYRIDIDNQELKAKLSAPTDGYDNYEYNAEYTKDIQQKLSKALKESGLLIYNKWNVVVAGLPPIYDMVLDAKFSSGEKLYIEFNGERYPNGLDIAAEKFAKAICELTNYSPEKCPKSKPYVNPYLGKHKFVYNKDGKTQTFTFILENTSGKDNAEVISEGDFGYFHARCYTSNLSNCYHFNILSYYDDSKITTESKHSIAGILYNNNGNLTLEPLRACPDLPDRSKLKEEK